MDRATRGWLNGFLGMLVFSGSLPATRLADASFAPIFLTGARATIAGVLALGLLLMFRQRRPGRGDNLSLAIVALGVVAGFPLLTAFALIRMTATHSIVFTGLLPLATAAFAVLRGGERPAPAFWLFACFGSTLVALYALASGPVAAQGGNLLMLAAIVICGLAYAEGAKLSRKLGGWQVICWALVLSLPIMAGLSLWTLPKSFAQIHHSAWCGLAYVSVFSMLIGFVFWYRGLAQGGIAAVGQLQLLQPFFGLALAALLLREPVPWTLILVTGAVALCVAAAKYVSKPPSIPGGVALQTK